jgi:hypothetical protein
MAAEKAAEKLNKNREIVFDFVQKPEHKESLC